MKNLGLILSIIAIILSICALSVVATLPPASCHTDSECGCTDDCLDPKE